MRLSLPRYSGVGRGLEASGQYLHRHSGPLPSPPPGYREREKKPPPILQRPFTSVTGPHACLVSFPGYDNGLRGTSMAVMPLNEAHDLAVRLHRSGNMRDAESVYRQILTALPDHVETLRML